MPGSLPTHTLAKDRLTISVAEVKSVYLCHRGQWWALAHVQMIYNSNINNECSEYDTQVSAWPHQNSRVYSACTEGISDN